MALSNASWTIGNAFGTGAGMNGYHQGLYSLDPLGGGSDEVWDHSHLSSAEVTKRIKKAALLFGASLVGITQMKEEWVYSKYSGMDNEAGINKQGDILITEVEKVELPEGQIARKEAQGLIVDEFQNLELADAKDTFIAAMESVDPSLLPPSAPPPAAMKAFPAGMLMGELPSILNEVPVEMLYYFAESFGLEFEIAAIDPSLSAKARYMEDGTLSIPETYNTCIVLAYEMDYEGYKTSPASPSGAATGNGYSRMAFTGACLAEFIRNLGYGAVPCGNNTALSVPLAIDAGLGEKSRMGCLVTPKYGPRVRLNKIFTNMPLDYDTPISFGVEQFCQVCKKCVDNCPSSALRDSEQSYTSDNVSNIKGVKKWHHDMEKYLKFWMENGNDCAICFTVCPFNKPEGWLHEATRILIGAQSGSLDKLLINLDDASGFGNMADDKEVLAFWDSDTYIHIKD